MRRTNSSPERWNLVPIPPESKTNTSFRWWEVVIISFLVLLVLGLLVAGITDHRSGQNRQSNDLAAGESRPLDAFHSRIAAVDSKEFEIRFSDNSSTSPSKVLEQ
jgi:hypothetical protein